MPPVDSSILEKLQKILSRADTSRGSTEAEAQAAMAAAQRLAIQHNIDLAQVNFSDPKSAKLETDKVGLKLYNKHRPYSEPIAHVLIECFDVALIWVGDGAVIVGEKTDVAIATYCWNWLNETFPRLFRQYCDARGLPFLTGTPRQSYYEGLSRGIRENNRRQRAETKASAQGQSFALVLVKKEEVVLARVAQEFPRLRTTQQRQRNVDWEAMSHGVEQGSKIKLNGGLGAGASQERLS